MRPPNHSVLIDWPWRWGYLVVADDEVLEVIFSKWSLEWHIVMRATLQ